MISLNYPFLLTSRNLQAFLRVIREGESWNDRDDNEHDELAFRVRYHPTKFPTLFDSFDQHPRVFEPLPDGSGRRSSAAGAFQIIASTWDDICRNYEGIGPTFKPYDQMCAAVALLHRRDALQDVIDGRFAQALQKCAPVWASLPDSPLRDGGTKMTYAHARSTYVAWGGNVEAEVQTPAPIEERSTPARPEDVERITAQEKPMAAPMLLIGPILQVITQLIPALSTLFGKDAEKYKDKIGAATQVVDIVTKAVGGTNAQDAVEKMQSDPAALQAAKVAVIGDPVIGPMLTEVGGGIQAAHQRNMDAASNLPMHKNPAFWISLLLLPMAYYVVIAVIGVPWDGKMLAAEVSQEVRSMVIGGIMGTVVGGIVAFWMGTSYGSARKTDMLAAQSSK